MLESLALDFLLDAQTITSEEKKRRHEEENYWLPSLSERCWRRPQCWSWSQSLTIFNPKQIWVHSWSQSIIVNPKENLSSQVNTLLGLWLTGAAAVLAVYAGCQAELAVFLFAVSSSSISSSLPTKYITTPQKSSPHRWRQVWTLWRYQAAKQGCLVSKMDLIELDNAHQNEKKNKVTNKQSLYTLTVADYKAVPG